MSIKALRLFFLLSLTTVFSAFVPSDKAGEKEKAILKSVIESLNNNHYRPIPIDNTFSEKAYDLYIKRLDMNKRFLVKEDIDRLKRFKLQLDNEVSQGSFEFFDLSIEILLARIKEAESYYTEILSEPFNFKENEFIELDPDKKEFAKDKKTLREDWRKLLKYEVLTRVDEQLTAQEKAQEKKDTVLELKTLEQLEQESREKVKKRYDDWFKRISQDDYNDRFAFYVNCLINVFDPHTGYFPPKDKENFDIQMSGQLEGIGAQLQEKDGYVKVVNIVPGSPSWKQGQLKEGDLILKVAQGDQEPVDVVDMRLDDAVKLIRGKKGTVVKLTVKKPDDNIMVIAITRDVVVLEETFAKSVILEVNGTGKKIGYLYLPSFYADFTNGTGKRASADVKAELEKLKKENIDGLIFDLRNNGGGSLLDAVDIAGYFIDKGPVVQVKGRYGPPYVYEDKDPAVIYDGPLMVMVNNYSASASEIFSAAIQDYGRGLIIGTPYTFGKGTVQRFVDLNVEEPLASQGQKLPGAVKVTIQKFYRINGGSTQLKGVTPDIVLPDPYGDLDRGEKETDYPMEWTSINPVNYKPWVKTLPLDKLRREADGMIASEPSLKLIKENALRLDGIRDETNINLDLENYRNRQKMLKEQAKKYEKIGKDSTGLAVIPLQADLTKINADSASQARASSWHNNLKKDIFLLESAKLLEQWK